MGNTCLIKKLLWIKFNSNVSKIKGIIHFEWNNNILSLKDLKKHEQKKLDKEIHQSDD